MKVDPDSSGARMRNVLTVDVEDYFQVSAFAPYVHRGEWDKLECRVERNVERILAQLEDHSVKATFFTLGWIAERYPQTIRQIVNSGHELASHGFGHQRVSDLDRRAFESDVKRAKVTLEDVAGVRIRGYRAPSFSINRSNLWAFDVLRETGHEYSSSVYPVRHDHYGMPDAPRFAHRLNNGLIEIPATTARIAGKNLPSGGGGFFRLLPYFVSRMLIAQVNRFDRQAAVFYFHPWEIDVDQPRIVGIDARTRFRHYVNIKHVAGRLDRLLTDFSGGRMDEVFLGGAARLGFESHA